MPQQMINNPGDYNTKDEPEWQVEEEPSDAPFDINAAIEAILFAAGHPLTYEELARPFEMPPDIMREKVYEFANIYNNCGFSRGVILLTFDKSCQLCTKQGYMQYIRTALGIRRSGSLSTSCIEALAIIAYNQPTTRAYVDQIRGVDSSYAITTLIERELIESKGRMDAPGRPVLYGTTDGFLRSFGLNSIAELPGLTSAEAYAALARMNKVAESEAEKDPEQLSLDDIDKETRPTAP